MRRKLFTKASTGASAALALLLAGCAASAESADPGASGAHDTPTDHDVPAAHNTLAADDTEEVELAVLMGEMQRHSAKLGYALDARNQRLAEFYLHEVEEIVEELLEIEDHDGIQVRAAASPIVPPLVEALHQSLENADWAATSQAYSALIEGCNRCHSATEHEFIVVLEPEGPPPYNQAF